MTDFFPVHSIPLAVFVALLALAAYSDAQQFRIPNAISLAMVAAFPIYVGLAPTAVPWLLASTIAVGILVLGLIAFSHGLIGGGDAKLLSAVALWAGPEHVLEFLFVTALAGGLLAVLALASARFAGLGAGYGQIEKIPYGVAIAAGGIAAVVAAPAFSS